MCTGGKKGTGEEIERDDFSFRKKQKQNRAAGWHNVVNHVSERSHNAGGGTQREKKREEGSRS